MRVVTEEGEQLGIMTIRDAIKAAADRNLDLVEVASAAKPPVCKFMDYGKFKYEQSKKAKKARQQSHVTKVKTIKFRPKTDDHDYDFKKEHIVEFLQKGNKVKVIMQYRGREMSHMDLGIEFLKELVDDVAEFGKPESRPTQEGRTVSLILMPLKGE